MHITIFGLTISSSWGNGHATPYRALIRALHRFGHSVRFYEKDVPYYARHRDFAELPYCDLVLYADWNAVRLDALAHAADSDVVIVASYCPEGSRISDEVLALSKPLKVFYDLDTPITLAKFASEGATEYLEPRQIPHFDLLLSFTGGGALRKLEKDYGARLARPLYGCVDPDHYQRVARDPDLACDLSYMGTYAADRQQKLCELFIASALRAASAQFLLAGSMYPWDWQWPANVRKLDHVNPSQHPVLYSSSRMTLNITRKDMADSGFCPSGRFFEASACGCPIVTDTWDGLDTFFTHDELLRVHSSEDILAALQLASVELDGFAQRARQRTLDEHTGMHRAQQLLTFFEEAHTSRTTAKSEAA